jgi:hypothetical protein
MNVGNRWFVVLALAAAAVAGVFAAAGTRRRRDRAVRVLERRKELREWENEGGNLDPAAPAPTRP